MAIFSTKKCFMFHEIVDDIGSTGFHEITNGKYSIDSLTFEQILLRYKDSAIYTFDDGGTSNLIAANILDQYGLCGIFFVITAKVGEKGFLSKDDLLRLSRKHIVASHSSNHAMGPQDGLSTYNDWFKSHEFLRKLNCETTIVALPGGYFDKNIYLSLKKLGISTVYHSAPISILLKLRYPGLRYKGRQIVTAGFGYKSLIINSIKSIIKQLWNMF